MEKTFNPKNIEQKLYEHWEKSGYFKPSGDKDQPYCIVIPPPNVTGSLHMGHGFQYSIMDTLIRYHRMCGDHTLWQFGTDHAGIATQLVVERELVKEGIKRSDLTREEFEKRAFLWKEKSKNWIFGQSRRLGISVDWDRERFTLDEGLTKAVQKVFIELFNEGLIYRGKRLANWDPVLHTAVSDLEVNFIEKDGSLWYIRYPLENGDGELIVATTRPETMLGDAAVAVNPTDPRYKNLVGKNIKLPLTVKVIPIIADDYVDKEFGTGCVKITPAHDFNDYQVGLRHKLAQINILTPDAHLNENVPEEYQGLERFIARKKIVADLEANNFLVKIEPYKNKVPVGDRSGAVLEPYLTDQWFVKMRSLADKTIEKFKHGEPKFIPENWGKTYLQWLENIEDWCISRQLWWGHRIPAWYDENGKYYVGENETEIRAKNNFFKDVILKQDEDVLDTWFSSALWPFSSLGWEKPDDENLPAIKEFYPTSVLVTGFDIIFFWVARMTMMGLKFTQKIPFKEVYITGLIRDSKGQKMSKSKGNVLDPIDLIDGINLEDLIKKRTSHLMLSSQTKEIEKATRDEFPNGIPPSGTDALRFTFCALATQSRDINFDVKCLEGYRNFCTKLWNATRFVLMNVENQQLEKVDFASRHKFDRWILVELHKIIEIVHENFKIYRFDLIAEALYKFIWNNYCDWYLEFSKSILNSENIDEALKRGTRYTLVEVLETILRLIHPIMPFISEEIWHSVALFLDIQHENTSLMVQKYPIVDVKIINDKKDDWQEVNLIKEIISKVRNIRSESGISPQEKVDLFIRGGSTSQVSLITNDIAAIKFLAKIQTIDFLDKGKEPDYQYASAIIVDEIHTIEIAVKLDNLDKEKSRLEKEIAKKEKDFSALKTRLDNPNFSKAPEAVQEKTKLEFAKVSSELEKLKEQIGKLK